MGPITTHSIYISRSLLSVRARARRAADGSIPTRPREFGRRWRAATVAAGLAAPLLLTDPAAAGPCQSSTDPFANPFSAASALHRPIGSGAVYASDSHATTLNLKRATFNNINSNNGWGVNVYKSTGADPSKRVTGPTGKGLPVTLRVPNGAHNQSTSDATVVIHDSTTNITHEFYQWRWNNGQPSASIHHQWSLRDAGHTGPGGKRVGSSASGVAGMFGLLRGHEVNSAGTKIEHAVQIALDARGKCGMMLKDQVVWPASSTDGFCGGSYCRGQIPYGALLAIPPSVNIASLGLSEPGRRLAQAMQNYGVYVVDNSQCPTLRGDQNIAGNVKQQLVNDMRKIYPRLRMVLNNNPSQSVAGGGTPRAANCAINAPGR